MDQPFPAYTGDQPYYFVSYAHKDAEVIYPQLIKLRDAGYNLWYDEGISPGAEWREELAAAIRGAKGFLLFVTPKRLPAVCHSQFNCLGQLSQRNQLCPGRRLPISFNPPVPGRNA